MRYLIYYLLFISSTLSAQDSLKQIPVVKWKLNILLDNYFYDIPACTATVNKFKAANDSVRQALADGGALIKLRTEERDAKVTEVEELRKALIKSDEATVLKVKEAKKSGRRQGGIFVIVLVVAGKIVYELVDN